MSARMSTTKEGREKVVTFHLRRMCRLVNQMTPPSYRILHVKVNEQLAQNFVAITFISDDDKIVTLNTNGVEFIFNDLHGVIDNSNSEIESQKKLLQNYFLDFLMEDTCQKINRITCLVDDEAQIEYVEIPVREKKDISPSATPIDVEKSRLLDVEIFNLKY